nr:MAG TPA: Inner kinetochore subunit IML3, Inner kinetochore, DNA, nucleosome, DNA.15A [Caudoviricetes sp.]
MMNKLKDYQPQTEALRNFSIDVSKKSGRKIRFGKFWKDTAKFY